MSFFFSFLFFTFFFQEKEERNKEESKAREGKRGDSNTKRGQTATAFCGGRFARSRCSSFLANRKRCPRFTGTVCAEGRLFSFFPFRFSFASFLEKKRREKPQTAPALWVPFVCEVDSFFFPPRLFFCFFLFSEKKE
ncbi:MAG: hypothetical protein IJF24_04070 [Clostridia bacterium]|nr:hypothetical protein [Clostridia bacterium]